MDRLEAMAMFVAATEEGSLAAAARRGGRSAASATRALALLEEYAGETLLVRSTRGLRLTPAGERKLIRMRLHLLNRLVDLVREGFDVAIRLAPLPDSGLTTVNVGRVRRLTCASPEYLERHGVPRQPKDLVRHVRIGLNPDASQELWPFAHRGGRPRASRVTTRLSVNGVGAALDTALRGGGLVRRQANPSRAVRNSPRPATEGRGGVGRFGPRRPAQRYGVELTGLPSVLWR